MNVRGRFLCPGVLAVTMAVLAVGCSTGSTLVITDPVVKPVSLEGEAAATGEAAAVGEDGSSVAGASFLKQVAAATEASDTYRFEMSFSMRMSDPTFDFDISPDKPLVVGAVSGTSSWMRMNMGEFFEGMAASMGPSEAGDLSQLLGADLTMETIYDGSEVLYLRAPMFASMAASGALPGGGDLAVLADGWATIDLSASTGLSAEEIAGLTGAQMSSSPDDVLELLRSAGSEIIDLGTADVRGVSTTHLRAVTDLTSMLEAQGMDMAGFGAVSGDLVSTFDIELPFDVFVDAEGRARRLTLEMDMDSFGGLLGEDMPAGTEFSFATTVDLYDFGIDPLISPPPSDQVAGDLTQVFVDLLKLSG